LTINIIFGRMLIMPLEWGHKQH